METFLVAAFSVAVGVHIGIALMCCLRTMSRVDAIGHEHNRS